jgi:hypothetical protein
MTMRTQACMGGWCALRDHCQHYHAASPYQRPSERLCHPGHDGNSDVGRMVTPIRLVRALPSQQPVH